MYTIAYALYESLEINNQNDKILTLKLYNVH